MFNGTKDKKFAFQQLDMHFQAHKTSKYAFLNGTKNKRCMLSL